jgi:hypothetical protein
MLLAAVLLLALPVHCAAEMTVLRGPWTNRTFFAPTFRVAGPQVFSLRGHTVNLMPYLLSLDPLLCTLDGPRPNVTLGQINATLAQLALGRIGVAIATLNCRDTALRLCQNTPGCPGLLFLHHVERFNPIILNQWGKMWDIFFPFNATSRVSSVYALFPRDMMPDGPNITFLLPEVQISDQLTGFQMTAESYGIFLQVFDALLLAVTAALAAFVAIQSVRRKLAVGIIVGCVEFSLTAVRFAVLCISWNSIHTTYSMCVNSIWLLLFVSPSMCCTLLVAVFWFYAALFPLRAIAWRALMVPILIASVILIAAEFVRPICECTIVFTGFPPASLRLTGIILIIVFYGLSIVFFSFLLLCCGVDCSSRA